MMRKASRASTEKLVFVVFDIGQSALGTFTSVRTHFTVSSLRGVPKDYERDFNPYFLIEFYLGLLLKKILALLLGIWRTVARAD